MSQMNRKLTNTQSNYLGRKITPSLIYFKQQKTKKNKINITIRNIINSQKNKGIYRSHIKNQGLDNISKIIHENAKDKIKGKLLKAGFKLNIDYYIKPIYNGKKNS